MDLRSFDLNLLVVLDALLTERSVSNAAKQLSLSQPAVSAALNRLRAALGDPILVRDGMKMVPTPRAEQLASYVRDILVDVETALTSPATFDPGVIKRKFRIATKDYGAFLFIPELMRHVSVIAPGVDIEIWDTGQAVEQSLSSGDFDIAITDAWELRHCKRIEVLFQETFTCLARVI
ncbi:MAG: LysR family transcriptional regulator [Phormidesmis sp.]